MRKCVYMKERTRHTTPQFCLVSRIICDQDQEIVIHPSEARPLI